MKASSLCVLGTALLAACAKGGTPTPENKNPEQKVCGADTAKGLVMAEISADPFFAKGKVILNEKLPTATKDSYALLDSVTESEKISGSSRVLDANTEVSVTLRDSCLQTRKVGVLSQLVLAGRALPEVSNPSDVRSYTWHLPSQMTVGELNQRAEADECVVGVADSGRVYASTELNDPLVPTQGHLKMIEDTAVLEQIRAMNLGKPVTIAIIDTGIDMNHEDLKNVLWTNPGEIPANGIDDDQNGYIDDVNGYNFALKTPSPSYSTATVGYQHGTHVSGLAAAQGGNAIGGSGVMGSGARILMLNVFGTGSGAYTSDIANAIRYAADNGADVINMSLGGEGKSATYESAIAYAISKGVTVLAAAGNEHREVGPDYWMSPGAYAKQFEGMIAIGSVDSGSGDLSVFSNYSSDYVELAAPGSEDSRSRAGLLSTWPGGKYARIQGTSMATPVAVGAAGIAIAMMRSRGYAPSPATIEELLETAARVDEKLRPMIRGGRVLNVRLLKEYIEANYPFRSGQAVDPGVPGYVPCGTVPSNIN